MTDGPDETLSPEQKHEIVMRHLTEAWDNATADGIDADFLASAMLAAALTNLGRRYGREAAVKLAASLPQRIEDGLLAID